MQRGEIYRTAARVPERGAKPGFYLIVSRSFIADSQDVSTVVCAPIYSEILGLSSEVTVGAGEGLPHDSAVRCDFLMLMLKSKLTGYTGSLGAEKLAQLDQALRVALELG